MLTFPAVMKVNCHLWFITL